MTKLLTILKIIALAILTAITYIWEAIKLIDWLIHRVIGFEVTNLREQKKHINQVRKIKKAYRESWRFQNRNISRDEARRMMERRV